MQIQAIIDVISRWSVFILKAVIMKQTQKMKLSPLHKTRLEQISNMLKEMRFSEGKNQSDFSEYGVSRRQIQRGEQACNISLLKLFTILDCYEGYTLSDFFEGMD